MSKNKITNEYFSEIHFENKEDEFNPEEAVYEFFNTAKQVDARGGFQFSKEKLERIADNFNDNILGQEVHININHDPEKKAVAWVKPGSMYVDQSKTIPGEFALFGQLYKFSNKGKENIKEGVFRYFSIEIREQFDRFIDGAKKTIKDVITGIAMTNTPAVKGMSPTFSEKEEDFSISTKKMDIKTIIGAFSTQSELTKREKSLFLEIVSQFSEEDLEENKEAIAEVETKEEPQEEIPETPVETPSEEHSEKALTLTFAETFPEEFAEMQKIKAENKERKFSELFGNSLVISNDREIGFLENAKPKVKEFCEELTDVQIGQFVSLFSEVTKVDLSQFSSTSLPKEEEDEESTLLKLKEKAKEMSNTGKRNYKECLNELISENASK